MAIDGAILSSQEIGHTTTEWHPASIFSSNPHSLSLLILNQAMRLPQALYTSLFSNSLYTVAADGGANRIFDLNSSPTSPTKLEVDTVIGDLDSLLPVVKKYWEGKNVPIIHDPDQYSTDFTKAVRHIHENEERKTLDIVAIGGLGGRVDQGLSTLHHLYTFQTSPTYANGRMYLLSSEAITFVLKTGRHRILVKAEFKELRLKLGMHVGIIPLKEKAVITTRGLKWDVEDWETEFGGSISTSNHVRKEWVEIETRGDVLFTIDLDLKGCDA